ncbi:MAG TPA: efflux RND transporter periplasmic adaptor subunit [Acetobacteraceae bacterium]|nr:efflux RND transporter periplasmic adaptor subunit [Acetobacteraceae bacterium]
MTKRILSRRHSLRWPESALRPLGLLLPFLLTLPAFPAHAAPPPAVTVTTVAQRNVAPLHSYIGRVMAIQSVQIVPRVTAFIESVPVKQGSDVKAGDIIYELQKTQYQAALQSAQAQLASAQAALVNDQVAYERAARLNHQGFEAQSNLDSAIATRDQAQAAVESAQANLAQAALNLSYCTIRSPIDGRIGAVALTKGNLVTPSTPAMATINQLDPIRVVFSVAAGDVMRAQQRTGQAPAQITKGLVVNLRLPDGSTYNQTGKIAFLGNQVDQQTGTVPVYADFANPQDLLLPGAYVSVLVRRAKPQERLLVPVAAVQTDQTGSYVLTVGAGNKVAQQPIVTGQQIAQNFIVTKGLSAGERVIVTGVQKVRPGEVVNPTEAAAPPLAKARAPAQAGKGS